MKSFYNSFYKIHHSYMYIKYIKNSSYKIFFFFFCNTLIAKLDRNALAKNDAIFFQLQSFVDKTTFNSHSFNKNNDFVTTQYATAVFYRFSLKPDEIKMGWRRRNSLVDKLGISSSIIYSVLLIIIITKKILSNSRTT